MWIAVDIDGVLAEAHRHILARFNTEHDTSYQKADITHWHMLLNSRDIDNVIREYYHDEEFLLSMPVIEGAREGMADLIKDHELAIITDRPVYADDATRWWLAQSGLVYCTYHNTQGRPKAAVAEARFVIDDYPPNLAGFECGILFDQPWNQGDYTELRAHNWAEVMLMCKRCERSKK